MSTARADDSYGRRPAIQQCDHMGAGAGPMIGGSFGGGLGPARRLFVGWEVSAGCPTLRGAFGGTYSLRNPGAKEVVYYVVYEPGFILGGTLGVSHSDYTGAAGVVGGWSGMAWPIADELAQEGFYGTITAFGFSVALGVRVRIGKRGVRTDLYLTPKLQYIRHGDYFT